MSQKLVLEGYGSKEEVVLKLNHYRNGRRAIQFFTTNGEPFMTWSVNLPEVSLPDNYHFWARTWGENEQFRNQLLASGLFEDTGRRVKTGFVEAELWKIVN